MTTSHPASRPSPVILLDTAWMPLEGITEQWAHLGKEATTVFALRATSVAFAALAAETDARARHQEAWYLSPYVDLPSLENAVQGLLLARQCWTEAMIALEVLLADASNDEVPRCLLIETLQQRSRLCCLLQELEREYLRAYQRQVHQREVALYAFGKEG